jgi:hypothetical protein
LAEWDWKSYTAAILGSGLVVFTVTTLYSTLINKPNINIDISKFDTIVEVTNKGLAPATHLILTIKSNAQITNPTIFSTENFTRNFTQNNSIQILKIQTPRFASGQGSNITINLPKPNTSLAVYATYDQGSIREPPIPSTRIYDDYLTASPIIIGSIGAIISFIYLIEQRSKNDILRFMAAKVYRDVREVVMKFKNGLNYDKPFVDDSRCDGGGIYSNKLWANPKFEGMKVKFFNKEDLVKLYEFFTSLIERDSVIKYKSFRDPLGSPRIHDANDKLNRAAQCAYNDISWEKYAGFKFIKFYVLGDLDSTLKVRFRMLLTVKDRKYALYQIISIGFIVVIVFYPALLSQLYTIQVSIVYFLTGVFLLWWYRHIDVKEKRRSEWEKREMKIENEREKIRKKKQSEKKDLDRFGVKADKELERLTRLANDP